MSLTDKRAKAIAAYFTAAGVEKKRILAVGKGDAEPELVPEQKESETPLSWVVLKIVKRPEIIEP
jgi:outer membrane protein OmpA-like peptidoglycan-associated protein